MKLGSIVAAAVCSVALSGCGVVRSNEISEMNATEIQGVSDHQLCNPYVSGSTAMQERTRRGLGDCSPAHLKCLAMGFPLGTSNYLQCRALIAQQDQAAAAATNQAFVNAGEALMRQSQPPPPPTGGGIAPGVAFLKSSYVSGLNRICLYDRVGSAVAITVGSAQLCPLTLQ